jgi:hypothetical protein
MCLYMQEYELSVCSVHAQYTHCDAISTAQQACETAVVLPLAISAVEAKSHYSMYIH